MRYLSLLIILVLFSCGNEKVIQLPEIENADITEVLDVSPAYIFYDETQPDSTLFNRKNLISTTNWLVNVDKRLTLRQAIPHIQYLQNKRKKASMHKNENANNYFTCNDTSIKNLGFLEFTDVEYNDENTNYKKEENPCFITIYDINKAIPSTSIDFNFRISKEGFAAALNIIHKEYDKSQEIIMLYNDSMNFQDYITIKNELKLFNNTISNDEFFFSE